jgi:hypothetical protein
MDTKQQIETTLARLFHEEGRRVVFWNDPEREFINVLPFVYLENVTVLRLDEVGALEAKIRLEREDTTGKYLIYSPSEEPDYEKDWLLDIRLYGRSFRADRASIILQELGLANQSLREHLAERRKFCDNKERLQKLKTLVEASDTDADLDRKMISVVVKADQPEWFTIIRTIYHAYTEVENGNGVDLATPPAVWEQVEKFELDKAFWQMAKSLFGYAEDVPCLRNFLIRLLVTDYAHHVKADLSPSLAHLLLPKAGASAVVCLGQWRDSSSRGSSYDILSSAVAESLSLRDVLMFRDVESLLGVMTFLDVEKTIIRLLRDRVPDTARPPAVVTRVAPPGRRLCYSIAREDEGERTTSRIPSTDKSAHGNGQGLAAAAKSNHAGHRPRERQLPQVKSRQRSFHSAPGRL